MAALIGNWSLTNAQESLTKHCPTSIDVACVVVLLTSVFYIFGYSLATSRKTITVSEDR
jgi:hypothetical protein